MKTPTTLLTLAGTAGLLSGCAMLGLGGEADARWVDYRSWSTLNTTPITEDHTGLLGGLHEGDKGVREIYINDTGWSTATGSSPYQYPVGTVLVKEQYRSLDAYNAGNTPGLTIMLKVSRNAENPADNWQWSRGYAREAGADTFCSGCHTAAMGSDFVFSNAQSLSDFR